MVTVHSFFEGNGVVRSWQTAGRVTPREDHPSAKSSARLNRPAGQVELGDEEQLTVCGFDLVGRP